MTVRVRLYAQLRDIAGMAERELEMSEGATVAELLEALYQSAPALRSRDQTVLVGAGLEFVDRNYVVQSNDEISIMPPLQGG